jgi:uncharacterized phage protein gp47/JayE
MSTLAPTIDASGIIAPDYVTILAQRQADYRAIYGSDIVLDSDTQDGQAVAIEAQAVHDVNQACIAVYTSFSPATALGAALSSNVKINGIARKVATASTVTVTVVGVAGTVITGGIIGDNLGLGTQWALPATVTIPSGGSIGVTATCTTVGATAAAPGTLTSILTPTAGWQTITNAASATMGVPVETDVALRLRQSQSVSVSSVTPLLAIKAATQAIAGVGRVEVYENDTNSTDGSGRPAHSITAVVEGGAAASVAAAIGAKKTPGVTTYGTTTQTWIDPVGLSKTINFYQLSVVPITLSISVHPLTGYLTSTADLIKAAVARFISSLDVGETCYLNRLWAPANLRGDEAMTATGLTQAQLDAAANTFNVTAILQARTGSPAASDVSIAFYEAASCVAGGVTITAV